MNIHEQKCRKLKAVRARLADAMGIDLHQRECQTPGKCRGTCPKCEAEERKLNDALLKRGTVAALAVAASVGLTGCSAEDFARLIQEARNLSASPKGQEKDPDIVELSGEVEIEDIDLAGDVPYYEENNGTDSGKPGDLEYEGEYELEGDVVCLPDDLEESLTTVPSILNLGDDSVELEDNELTGLVSHE